MKLFSRTFFHPFMWLKTWMPKTLLGRSLIIIIAPVILIQSITTYVFIDRHWTKMTELLANEIAGDAAAVISYVQNSQHLGQNIRDVRYFASRHFDLQISVLPFNRPVRPQTPDQVTWEERFLYRALSRHISLPFHVQIDAEDILIQVATLRGNLEFQLATKRLFTRTTPLLLWWALGTPVIFLLIAILFMRNQVRPLTRLSEAVDQFGRGHEVKDLPASGALEIRKVSRAFNEMRQRIHRQITQRTEMLAGISHDLRTPLTRMKLQLAMLKETKDVKSMKQDLDEMEKMINEYLAFARGQEGEKSRKTNVVKLVKDLVQAYPNKKIQVDIPVEVGNALPFVLKENAFRRCLSNLLDNALRYAGRAWIRIAKHEDILQFIIEDNGPGIPESAYQDVFRPFFRLDQSRNANTGGSGLGLAIAKDIVHAHGGQIALGESNQGGLKVTINIPV